MQTREAIDRSINELFDAERSVRRLHDELAALPAEPLLDALTAALAAALPISRAVEAKEGGDAKAKAEVASQLAAFAKACADAGAKAEAEKAVARAKSLDAAAPGVKEAQDAVDAVPEEKEGAAEAVSAARKVAGPKVAKGYDQLAGAYGDPKDARRATAALVTALTWEPSKPRIGKAQKGMVAALGGNRPEDAARLHAGLCAADPETAAAGKFDGPLIEAAQKELVLIGSPTHDLLAYLSLPKGWQKGKTYPIVVGVDGAGSNFLGYGGGCRSARGSRAAIVLAPITLSNTNTLDPVKYPMYGKAVLDAFDGKRMEFDGPGVDAILAILSKRFGADEKVFVTGFSGGGNWCYWKLFMDPAHVRGAAPACANFAAPGYGVSNPPGAGEGGGPTVKLMTGAQDEHRDHVFGVKPGIEGQTDAAESRLKELGYTKVSRVQLQAGHSPLHAEVWKFVDEVTGAK